MRLFQNSGLYPAYRPRLKALTAACRTFAAARDAFLADRFGACHFLQPVLEKWDSAFFTNGDDPFLQGLWAREKGLSGRTALADVLLAQIEEHKTEVFYNLDPMRYSSDFVRRLPGCVKHSVAWRAAPSPRADFSAYNLVVCNFASILKSYAEKGWRNAYFAPAHDPEMDRYSENANRPVDVVFVGGYSRHHRRRAELLEGVARECQDLCITYHLDRSRLTRIAESPLGMLMPLGSHRRPREIRRVSLEPVFGLQLYSAISRAKIVLNAAIDMAGNDRGNMRCFETFGCGALLVTDEGNYPEGMVDGETMFTFGTVADAIRAIRRALETPALLKQTAARGTNMTRTLYGKQRQWREFIRLTGEI